jgi:hypothetical protein
MAGRMCHRSCNGSLLVDSSKLVQACRWENMFMTHVFAVSRRASLREGRSISCPVSFPSPIAIWSSAAMSGSDKLSEIRREKRNERNRVDNRKIITYRCRVVYRVRTVRSYVYYACSYLRTNRIKSSIIIFELSVDRDPTKLISCQRDQVERSRRCFILQHTLLLQYPGELSSHTSYLIRHACIAIWNYRHESKGAPTKTILDRALSGGGTR